MCNLSITTQHYNTQTTLPLEVIEENNVSKRTFPPTFKTYDNRQVQIIFNIEELIPANMSHVWLTRWLRQFPMNCYSPIIPAVEDLRSIQK